VPTVSSSHASLVEASGQAAFRADPESPEAVAAALETALERGGERIAEGLAHARQFTWEACGEAVLHGYESVLCDTEAMVEIAFDTSPLAQTRAVTACYIFVLLWCFSAAS